VARKPTDQVQLKFRVPDRLRATIEKRAKKSGRSLSGEIVAMLEMAIDVGDWNHIKTTITVVTEKLHEMLDEARRARAALTPEQRAIMDAARKRVSSEDGADDKGGNK
jgi:Arc-like DNA binding domain